MLGTLYTLLQCTAARSVSTLCSSLHGGKLDVPLMAAEIWPHWMNPMISRL